VFYELEYALNVVFESTWRRHPLITTGIADALLAETGLVLLLSYGATQIVNFLTGYAPRLWGSISWPSQPMICFSPIRSPSRWHSSRSRDYIGSFHGGRRDGVRR
jgi:hypothetical protein